MRPSIPAKVFLGFAVVLTSFALVIGLGLFQLRSVGQGIALVSQAYHPLMRLGAQLDSSYRNSEQATARLLDERDVRTRRALLHLALDYHPRAALEKVRAAQTVIQRARQRDAARGEQAFLDRVDGLLSAVQLRYDEYQREGANVSSIIGRMVGAEPSQLARLEQELDPAVRRLKKIEGAIGLGIRDFSAELEDRIDLRVREASREERRSVVMIGLFSLLAAGVGVFVTVLSQRTLAPIGPLTQAVKDVGEGRFAGEVPVRSDDELGLLAREFNAMARKLSERERQLQEKTQEVLRAERLAAVGRLAAQITHEIRNPLSSLSLNLELLEETVTEGDGDDEARSLVHAMSREVDRLTEVTEDYLRLSRLPRPSPSPVDLNDAVEDLLDFLSRELQEAGVRVERELSPESPSVRADSGQLRQVLLNLVRNAREAMDSGGTVTVRTRVDEPGRLAIVEIQDTGPGISEELRARMFDPFFSTKDRGTGLGLAFVQQVVHEHGGRVECDSEPGQGACMRVSWPLAELDAPADPASDLDAAAQSLGRASGE